QIRSSRVDGTTRVVEAMRGCARPPRVLLSASAIGFYGDRGSEPLDEASAAGKGFLAEVCQAWEAAARGAEALGARVVLLRTGLVLSPDGGALARLAPLFRAFLGGRVGSGRQVYSWIAREDVVGAIHFALRTPGLKGPLNLTAPEPVTNGAFTEALGEVLQRPTPAPVPTAAILGVFGEMGKETLLSSAQVSPRALLEAGFTFRWPGLREALRFCLGVERLPSAA
ncbi:MAG TPA: TIGR01777 family oxidoreductase, partial [Myxococcaceae bacterium]|nr:TIGR01777 family oxidoreductase [Myxococcaceae bacterium]